MTYTPIGRVRPIHRGAHDPAAAYEALDVVRSADGFACYMALRDVPAGAVLEDGEYWGLLADAGLKAIADAFCAPFEQSGDVVQVWPVAGYPLEVSTAIAPVQAGSGDPSPDNVRPISGWTSAKLTRCGKNLLNSAALSYYNNNASDFSSGYGGVPHRLRTNSFEIPGGRTYTLSGLPSGVGLLGVRAYDRAKTYSTAYSSVNGNTFALSDEVCYIHLLFHMAADTTAAISASDFDGAKLMIEQGSNATEYAPYQGDTYTASFGQTVYGGTLDWATGVLTVDRAMKTLTGTENYTNVSGWQSGCCVIYDSALPGAVNVPGYNTVAELVCSHAMANTPAKIASAAGLVGVGQSDNYLYISMGTEDKDSLIAYLAAQYAAGTPVQVVYKLATPTTIQLTPQEVAALAGINTLYSDAGETTVSGRSDTVWVFQSFADRIAALEG